ncbi:MAG: AI-2E family transporter [Anaerovoracaceae bacterium]
MRKIQSHYVKIGLTAFIVISASIILFFLILRMDALAKGFTILTEIMQPFILGLILAFLLCPLYNFIVRKTLSWKWPKIKGKEYNMSYSRIIATVASILTIFIIVGGLLSLVLPQLIDSITRAVKDLPFATSQFLAWLEKMAERSPYFSFEIQDALTQMTKNAENWVRETILPSSAAILGKVYSGVFGAFTVVINIFVGIIVCIFFLNRKDIFAAQIKKILFASLSNEKADAFLRGSVFTNKTFGGFVNGKILDSFIIGVITFVFMIIVGWPYPALIAVIIGVTNIIPFFGPFIGAVPAALLIYLGDKNPMTVLYFLIFILVLQQVDGNIIGPKILGDSTGISSFWVLFAIIVGGGIFGLVGMITAIPIFAVIYAYIAFAVNKKLDQKGFSSNLNDYMNLYKYDPHFSEKKDRKSKSLQVEKPTKVFVRNENKVGEDE